MAKLKTILVSLVLVAPSLQAKTLQLEFYAQTSLTSKLTINNGVVGGLSGMFWDGTKLTAVSDDRGKRGRPRFYELDLKITTGKVDMMVTKAESFKDMPKDWVLDLEGIAPLPNGDFLVSTEGDNNHKPRAMPHIFLTSSTGVFKSDISLPDKYLPEATGQQKKGIEDNRGFEGLTIDSAGQNCFIVNEYPIIADQGDEDLNIWLRLAEFKKDKDSFKWASEFPYLVTRSPRNSAGVEVFRGISELLYASDNQLIVLERGARLTKSGLAYTGGLYLVDTTGAKDVSMVKNLSDGSTPSLKKEKLVDFEELFKNQKVENFEGLTWGPTLADGRKTLLVISDNNFAVKEKTTLLVFAVKEGKK